MRENWFEVEEYEDERDGKVVTYVKYWKLALLKWTPFMLVKTFLVGGWNDLEYFKEHKLMIELFQWYCAPIKRIDKSVK